MNQKSATFNRELRNAEKYVHLQCQSLNTSCSCLL